VVSEQHVDLSRKLALEGRKKIDELMGLIAAARIESLAVDHFLKDQMPIGVIRQVGRFVDDLKIAQVAMEVANDEHLRHAR
jgi:hypothetical protein